jgi:hypothetical protein
MQLRTGFKALIGVSVVGVAMAIFLIFTCPFAGQIAFNALVRQAPMAPHEGGHAQQHSAEQHSPHGDMPQHTTQGTHGATEPAHAAGAVQHGEHTGFSVHLMVVPGVQAYPAQETKVVSVDVSWLGVLVLLILIALCWRLLQQRPVQLWQYTVTPTTLGRMVVLITLWNFVFAAFLFGVEAVQFNEL